MLHRAAPLDETHTDADTTWVDGFWLVTPGKEGFYNDDSGVTCRTEEGGTEQER